MAFSLAGNDQGRARFIDEDRIHFIDDAETQAALDPLACFVDHVVAQVIEAEFVIRAIRDVGGIRFLLRIMRHLRQVHASRQAEPAVQAPHPFGIALREIIVDRDDMHALAGERIEVRGQRGHERLAFAGAHFSDFAVMQNHAADELDIEVTHFQDPLASFATHGKRFRQQGVERFAIRIARLQCGRLCLQLGIGKLFHGRLEGADFTYGFLVLLEQALIAAAKNLGQ